MTQAEANRSPRPALGWGAACALTASACWLSCILPTRLAFGPWAWFQTDCEETIFASRLFAISFGAWGLIVGGAAYVLDSLIFLLFPAYVNVVQMPAMICYSVAEVAAMFWLLIKGARRQPTYLPA